ncbi:MAG: AraC family transcriptional regulator [Clostridiales bacterium]|nr:AraC family transcriptional regulator [Clostridiales bacterium]
MEDINKDFEIRHKISNSNIGLVNHHHTTHEIIFIKAGKSEFLIEGKKYSLKKNCLLFIANFERHMHASYETPYERYYILLGNNMMDNRILDFRLMSLLRNRPDNYCHMTELSQKDAEELEALFTELLREYNDNNPYKLNCLKLKVSELFIFLYRKKPEIFMDYSNDSYANTVIGVQQYLNDNFHKPLLLKDVAAEFYTDMYYLSTKFKKIIGYTFKQYLSNLRISQAKHLLQNTDTSVAEIAADCGFADTTNFIRAFKKNEGISPLKYRKNNIKEEA